MTPDNDKTIRGIFRPAIGNRIAEFEDRRQYIQKYETDFTISDKSSTEKFLDAMTASIISSIKKPTATILRNLPKAEDEDYYLSRLCDLFPESKVCREFIFYMSFGMARDINGNFSNCDCCGRDLNALNCGGNHGMCDDCQEEYYLNKDKIFDIR